MTNEQDKVVLFMEAYKQECPDKPAIPSVAIRQLRARLIMEEAIETCKGLGMEPILFNAAGDRSDFTELEYQEGPADLVEIADGLADLHYVAYCGTGAAIGVDMEPVFLEVHRSNMTKLWSTKEKIEVSVDGGLTFIFAGPAQTTPEQYTPDAKIWVAKNTAGKAIKSPSYSRADIARQIELQSQ
jgi:predicted HAD superfamily Cof-like phosphohydrolase